MPTGIYPKEKRKGLFLRGHKQLNTGKTRFKEGRRTWNKGLIGYGKGRKHSEKTKENLRKKRINNPTFKFKDTDIELKIEAELQRQNINYQKQVPLCRVAIVDFYLPEYRIVIQCDGDYWHNRPGIKEKDERQDKILTFNGFNVYRFWEHEINNSVDRCINRVLNLVKN